MITRRCLVIAGAIPLFVLMIGANATARRSMDQMNKDYAAPPLSWEIRDMIREPAAFDINVNFEGTLSDEERNHVPARFAGAMWISAVRDISSAALSAKLQGGQKVGDENRGANRYVAIRVVRSAPTLNEPAGICIERYRITKPASPLKKIFGKIAK